MFRFHTGSIKSVSPVRCEYASICFDSILVRLKAATDNSITATWAGFDSILVRLKVFVINPDEAMQMSFDSILVRLKVKAQENLQILEK